MNKDPFVDVIMPNYNKGEFLEESINSVITQEYKNWNLFIIDNFSKDSSRKILNNYKSKHKNIYVFNLFKNKGAAFSRNLGMRFSKSKYIAFLDSDDFWPANKIKNQITFMEKFNHIFTYSDYTPFIKKNNNKIFKKKIILPNSFNYNEFINNTSISSSSMMIKRSYIGTLKFPKVKTFEDYSFKCKILKKGITAVKIESGNAFYRITKNSLSSNKLRNLYWLWLINKNHNKLSILENIKSLISISLSSLKKYRYK